LREIDMSLSLRITSMLAFTSGAWFSASKAMPAVSAPSPITAIALRSLPRRGNGHAQRSADRGAGVADAKGVVLALGRRGKAATALLAQGAHALATTGEDLVRIRLMMTSHTSRSSGVSKRNAARWSAR
jgi:hypothetical protein